MSAWIKAANDEPQKEFIPMWNNQQDIQFRPWRLLVDPNSQASRDEDFKSAFTNNPLKTWTGEVGALILSHSHLFAVPVENPSTGLVKALEDYRKLIYLWTSYKGSCSDRECPVCKGDRDRSDGEGDRSDKDGGKYENDNATGSDDQEEDQEQENKENEGNESDVGDEEDDGRMRGRMEGWRTRSLMRMR